MEISYLHANFVEGSFWWGPSSFSGRCCYKPSAISQYEGFYQFTARGNDCRLIKSLASSDRKWKTEFIFVSGFWARNPVDIGKDPFPPYTEDLGNFCPEGTSLPLVYFYPSFYLICLQFLTFVYSLCCNR